MNNVQENQLGMFLKVRYFINTNHDDLVGVVDALNDVLDAYEPLLTQLLAKASEVQEDITGTAEMKAETRSQLEELTLKVARALWAHATVSGNVELARACDLKRSDLTGATDAQLYLAADRIRTKATPLAAQLVNFTISAANLTHFGALLTNFLDQSELPKLRIEARKWANEELQMLFDKVNALLTDKLDVYMSLFEFNNLALFELYSSARSIDVNSGGATITFTGTVAAGAVAIVFTKTWNPGRVLSLTNTGSSELQFAFSDTDDPLQGTPLTVPAGANFELDAVSFGNKSNTLRVKNTGTAEGSYRVKEI